MRAGRGGPGPNAWEENNVWLDARGSLHLRIFERAGKWSCAEVTLKKRLGFGRYQFQVSGRLDKLDPNVVLGLFNYPTADVGPDGTNEIDIEFAGWGNEKNPIGNYTVWPAVLALRQTSKPFPFTLATDDTTHRFDWSPAGVKFQSVRGHMDEGGNELASWSYFPDEPARRISQQPMPVHINLWLFQGMSPKNGHGVEIVIHQFKFTPG